MGQEINSIKYDRSDFDRFYQSLQLETKQLAQLIENEACSSASPTAGFEIEAWLVDQNMQAAPINHQFLSSLNEPLACPELAKFNIELNSPPMPLAGNVFSHLLKTLNSTWDKASQHAENTQSHLLMIGTLPTLKQSDLCLSNMSDLNRYRALNEQILRARGQPIHLEITGNDHLKFDHHDVMLESATTSLQIHTQVPLTIAHHYYNASIIASAAVVAVSANAPYLFGKNLWRESRIPLFEQAIETGGYDGAAHGPIKRVSFGSDYARQSIIECFNENLEHFPVLLPEYFDSSSEQFDHLRLHNGTIWRWNRPLVGFDEDGTPHIRIEHRTPAAGPTTIDAIANAAFYYGLAKNICDEMIACGKVPLPFSQSKDNFYQAARYGLDSSIIWFDGKKQKLLDLLKSELLPRAVLGLKSLGITTCDSEDFLEIILQRISNKQTGSRWQFEFMQNNQATFKAMTYQYWQNQCSGKPVSEWNL